MNCTFTSKAFTLFFFHEDKKIKPKLALQNKMAFTGKYIKGNIHKQRESEKK